MNKAKKLKQPLDVIQVHRLNFLRCIEYYFRKLTPYDSLPVRKTSE